jgi:hypothetical protein
MAAPGDIDVKVVELVLRSIDFRVTIVTLLLGACGVAVGRMWQAGERLPATRVLWRIGPAVVGSGIVLWLLGSVQKDAVTALTRGASMQFAAAWVNQAFYIDAGIAAAFALYCLGVSKR